jgi:hypothetical protein
LVSGEDATAGDPQAAPVAPGIEVAAFPGSRRRIFYGRNGEHPMQVLHIAKQMEILFELRDAGAGVFLGRGRV